MAAGEPEVGAVLARALGLRGRPRARPRRDARPARAARVRPERHRLQRGRPARRRLPDPVRAGRGARLRPQRRRARRQPRRPGNAARRDVAARRATASGTVTRDDGARGGRDRRRRVRADPRRVPPHLPQHQRGARRPPREGRTGSPRATVTGRVALLRDEGAPPELPWALACSISWHSRRPTLLLVVDEHPPEALTSLGEHANVASSERAAMAIYPSLAALSGGSLSDAIEELFLTYDHIIVLAPAAEANALRTARPLLARRRRRARGRGRAADRPGLGGAAGAARPRRGRASSRCHRCPPTTSSALRAGSLSARDPRRALDRLARPRLRRAQGRDRARRGEPARLRAHRRPATTSAGPGSRRTSSRARASAPRSRPCTRWAIRRTRSPTCSTGRARRCSGRRSRAPG